MKNRLYCNRMRLLQATKQNFYLSMIGLGLCLAVCGPLPAFASDAPAWMHALTNAPVPAHDEKTDAVILYSQTDVTVVAVDRIKTHVRVAYKILRPEGRDRAIVPIPYTSPQERINSLHGWCIPAQGKDYEVKDKDGADVSLNVDGGELVTDLKARVIQIPAADPGNIIGYEYEKEEVPYVLRTFWQFQETVPSAEVHFSLQLPAGWEYKSFWLNYPEAKATAGGTNQWDWTLTNVSGIRTEPEMPPMHGVEGQMWLSFFAPGGTSAKSYTDWKGMGDWYFDLTRGRLEASQAIKDEVKALTASKTTTLGKMQAIADYVQHDIRYVAIELGIGGWQPHPAADVFVHKYGDCKDKATLMRSMLNEIGIDTYHVVINSRRGSITPQMPAHQGFDHAIIAIKLPKDVVDPSLVAVRDDPRLGRILFFDPTNDVVPFGEISGSLQDNYGLLVTPDGGELVELPQEPSTMNGVQRTAKFTIDQTGALRGEVKEIRLGDRAAFERWRLRAITNEADQIKPIEDILGSSLANFHITQASVSNLKHSEQPFGFNYSLESNGYAKSAGGMLLVRTCVIGKKESGFLETKEPRKFPVEFEGPMRDTDSFEIAIPSGYAVDDLPAPVDADYSFASYHSKSVVDGGVIRYTRSFEIKELSVPVDKADDLRKFYRIIAGDERSAAVLKASIK